MSEKMQGTAENMREKMTIAMAMNININTIKIICPTENILDHTLVAAENLKMVKQHLNPIQKICCDNLNYEKRESDWIKGISIDAI